MLSPLTNSDVFDVMYEHHFLWSGIARSNTSADEVLTQLRPEMEQIGSEYAVSGLILFLEVDKTFTCEGEIHNLVQALIGIAGGNKEGLLFKHGEIVRRVPQDQLLETLKQEILEMAK